MADPDDEPFVLRPYTAAELEVIAQRKREAILARGAATRAATHAKRLEEGRRWRAHYFTGTEIRRAIWRFACALARHKGVEPPAMPDRLKPTLL